MRAGSAQTREKSTKINFLGPETARWGGGLPRKGVVAKNFVLSLESLSSLCFKERNLGCPGNFAGMSLDPGLLTGASLATSGASATGESAAPTSLWILLTSCHPGHVDQIFHRWHSCTNGRGRDAGRIRAHLAHAIGSPMVGVRLGGNFSEPRIR